MNLIQAIYVIGDVDHSGAIDGYGELITKVISNEGGASKGYEGKK